MKETQHDVLFSTGYQKFFMTLPDDRRKHQTLPERREAEKVAAGIFPATAAGMDGLQIML